MKKLLCTCLAMMMALSMAIAPALAAGEPSTLLLGGVPDAIFDHFWNNCGDMWKVNTFGALFRSTADLNGVEPYLCSEYAVSNDNMQFVFTLRDDVTWHDGAPFGPKDVQFSIETALRAAIVNGIYVTAFKSIDGAEAYAAGEADAISGIEIGENTVTITLAKPYGAFLNVLAQFMLYPEHLLADADPKTIHQNEFWEHPIGVGPYKLAEVVWGNYAIFDRYEGYFGEKPQIERIKLQKLSDTIVACKAGQLDYFNTNNIETIREIEKIGGYVVYPVDTYFMRYFIMNLDSPEGVNEKLADVRIRQALLYAIDREAIVQEFFPNGDMTDTFVPSGYADYWQGAEHYDYNPEKAKALLAEAGYDFSSTLRLRYYYNDQTSVDLMDLIAFYWGEVGVKTEPQLFQGDATTQIYETRNHDIVYKGLSAFGYEEAYGEMVSSGNIMKYLVNDDVYDALLTELNATLDPAARAKVIEDLQKLDQEYLYRLPFFSLQNCIVVNTNRLKTAEVLGNEWWNYNRHIEDWEILQ